VTQVSFSGRGYLSHSKGEPERRQCGLLGSEVPRASQTDGADLLQSYLEVWISRCPSMDGAGNSDSMSYFLTYFLRKVWRGLWFLH